jgi:glucose-1-phosphate thymidylyltransferase
MKGIVLAGGEGTRLHPLTSGLSKQLLPVYDKPMIYYPISILMLANIRDILVITTPEDEFSYKRVLGDGSNFGINLSYKVQEKPNGLAEAFILGESFIGDDTVALVLGDNIFYGQGLSEKLHNAVSSAEMDRATIFGYQVKDPSRFGIVEFNKENLAISIEEKPINPKSNFAVTGLYFYPNSVIKKAKNVKPSRRNELEITSINNAFLEVEQLNVELLGRGFAWLDTGTTDSLIEASQFVQTIERRQGYKIACLEEVAYGNDWLTEKQIKEAAQRSKNSEYGDYLTSLI